MKRTQRRGMPDDTDALLGALADGLMDLHFTATAVVRQATRIIARDASAEDMRAHERRLRSLQEITSRLQAAVLGRTDHAADGRQLRLA